MTTEPQEVETTAKYQRTISLTQDIATRLQAVCDHLGVTASAYIKQALGEAVSKHEVSLLAKQSKDSSTAMLEQFFKAALADVNQDEAPDAPKPKRAAKTK